MPNFRGKGVWDPIRKLYNYMCLLYHNKKPKILKTVECYLLLLNDLEQTNLI